MRDHTQRQYTATELAAIDCSGAPLLAGMLNDAKLTAEQHLGLVQQARGKNRYHALAAYDRLWQAMHRDTMPNFPGSKHAAPANCSGTPPIGPRPRDKWVARHLLNDLRGEASESERLAVAEIGPCNMPTDFVPHMKGRPIRRQYLDFTANLTLLAEVCYGTAPERIVYAVDAQTVSNVPSSRFDALIAFHVMEHMANPIGAIGSWLRTLRPGGLLFIAVPDVCSLRGNVDKHRLTAGANHFARDYEQARGRGSRELMPEHTIQHLKEIAVSVSTFHMDPLHAQDVREWTVNASARATARGTFEWPLCGSPLSMQPFRAFKQILRDLDKIPHTWLPQQPHFHAWSATTMLGMLKAARHVLRNSIAFEVLGVVPTKGEASHMQELHVALRRRAGRPLLDTSPRYVLADGAAARVEMPGPQLSWRDLRTAPRFERARSGGAPRPAVGTVRSTMRGEEHIVRG
jgi:hypothetical protein